MNIEKLIIPAPIPSWNAPEVPSRAVLAQKINEIIEVLNAEKCCDAKAVEPPEKPQKPLKESCYCKENQRPFFDCSFVDYCGQVFKEINICSK